MYSTLENSYAHKTNAVVELNATKATGMPNVYAFSEKRSFHFSV